MWSSEAPKSPLLTMSLWWLCVVLCWFGWISVIILDEAQYCVSGLPFYAVIFLHDKDGLWSPCSSSPHSEWIHASLHISLQMTTFRLTVSCSFMLQFNISYPDWPFLYPLQYLEKLDIVGQMNGPSPSSIGRDCFPKPIDGPCGIG